MYVLYLRMNKLLVILLTVLAYTAAAQQKTQRSKPVGYEVFDQDGYSNLRKEKSTSSAVIEKLKTGEKIEILDQNSDWWFVKTSSGRTGYLHKSRIRNVILNVFDQVSSKFTFSITARKFRENSKVASEVNVYIGDKKNPDQVVHLIFTPEYWMKNDLTAVSYLNKTAISEGVEHYHGFIVADYNFDGLEDFAVLNYEGGNGGPLYAYFLQDRQGHFSREPAFPLQEGVFPKKIDPKTKTLTISGPVGCCSINTAVYQLKANNKWTMISSKQEKM